MTPAQWELVISQPSKRTERLKVPGGWIYWVQNSSGGIVFVPAAGNAVPVADGRPSTEVLK